MDITKAEYELLKEIQNTNGLDIKNEISNSLERKGLIEHKFIKLNRNGSRVTNKEYTITNAGVLALEQRNEYIRNLRSTSIRSWIAIIISLISLTVVALNFIFTWFLK